MQSNTELERHSKWKILAVLSCNIFVGLMPFIKTHVNENMFSCICNFAILFWIFMKFSPKCRTKVLGMGIFLLIIPTLF